MTTLNPKKNHLAKRKRNPLPVLETTPKVGSRMASILAMRKQHKNLCKECTTRQREYGSSRCAECSENHITN